MAHGELLLQGMALSLLVHLCLRLFACKVEVVGMVGPLLYHLGVQLCPVELHGGCVAGALLHHHRQGGRPNLLQVGTVLLTRLPHECLLPCARFRYEVVQVPGIVLMEEGLLKLRLRIG